MNKYKILFVCEGNAIRSPTFELWFKKNRPQYEVRSAGTAFGYPYSLPTSPIEDTFLWANKIFVMDMLQHRWIKERYPQFIDKVEIIGISDQFARCEKTLCNLVDYWCDLKKI